MSQAQDAVRDLAAKTLSDLGIVAGELECESLLIRDGYYVGRHFRFAAARAVWFVDANTFKFYGANGQLLKVLRPQQQTIAIDQACHSGAPAASTELDPPASRSAA
jgi:hypothetical protein